MALLYLSPKDQCSNPKVRHLYPDMSEESTKEENAEADGGEYQAGEGKSKEREAVMGDPVRQVQRRRGRHGRSGKISPFLLSIFFL